MVNDISLGSFWASSPPMWSRLAPEHGAFSFRTHIHPQSLLRAAALDSYWNEKMSLGALADGLADKVKGDTLCASTVRPACC